MKKMTENVHYHTVLHLFAEKSHYSLDRLSSHWGLQFPLELWFRHTPIGFLLESSEYQLEKFSFPVSNDFEQTALHRSK